MIAALILALAGLPSWTAAERIACLDAPAALDAIDRRDALPLDAIKRIVGAEYRGDVIAVRLCPSEQGLIYFLAVLEKGGVVARVSVDAATGSLLEAR